MEREPLGELPEQQTPETRRTQIASYKRTIARSTFLAVVALAAILAVCLAWFANNQRVSVEGVQVSVKLEGFELAAVGGDGLYDEKMLDVATGSDSTIGQGTYIQTSGDRADIRWAMSKTSNLENVTGTGGIAPNTSGQLTFYVIPHDSGTLTVDFTLSVTPYREGTGGDLSALAVAAEESDAGNTADDDELVALLEGHILFFRGKDDDGLYTEWLRDDTFSITFENVQAGEPQKVTIYWVWPNVVGQYLLETPPYGALFSPSVRQALQEDMMNHPSRYFYGQYNVNTLCDFIQAQNTDELSLYYNQADEQIGKNIDYLSVVLSAQLGTTLEATQTNGTEQTTNP